MGELADLIIDGEVCQICMCEMGTAIGYPRTCRDCARPAKGPAGGLYPRVPVAKVRCPICKRAVKAAGLVDHNRALHPAGDAA